MKSTIQENQKNNLKNVSKSTIIFLGLVALSFTTATATTQFKSQDLEQQDSATSNVECTKTAVIHTEESNEMEATVLELKSIVTETYVKTIEDTIAEDKLITESTEENFQPLSLEFTLEDRIAEDNQIIESTISNEIFPLDFKKINRAVKTVNVNNNAIKLAELKL